MHKKIIVILLLFSSFCPYLGAKEEIKVENRGNGWTLNTFDPTSLEPTTLKYFHYFDVLPEDMINYLRYNGRHFNHKLCSYAVSRMKSKVSFAFSNC